MRREINNKLVLESDFRDIVGLDWADKEREVLFRLQRNGNKPIPTLEIKAPLVERINMRLRNARSDLMVITTSRYLQDSSWYEKSIILSHTTMSSGRSLRKKVNLGPLGFVGYCGLYCPGCYKMTVSKAAKELTGELDRAEKKNASCVQYCNEEFIDTLGKLVALYCTEFCRSRKQSTCEISKCCIQKILVGCWECDDFETCPNLTGQLVENCSSIATLGVKVFVRKMKSKHK